MNYKLALFEEKEIRRTREEGKWYFSVVDVVFALTDSKDPRDYWYRLKQRVSDEEKIQLSTICRQLKLESSDGKKYKTDCADTEGILRIIQSIPSKKAEPFKRWLAKVGSERIEEIQNLELAMDRMKEIYEKKGYSKSWINMGERGIATRHSLINDMSEAGSVINSAKKEIERKLEKPIVTSENYIELTEDNNLKLPN